MDLQDFMKSGILEDHCLGQLNPSDLIKLEEMCILYPELLKELQLVQASIEKYKSDHKNKDNNTLKREIWLAIKNS